MIAPLVEEGFRLLLVLSLARWGRLVMLSAGFAAALELALRLVAADDIALALFVGVSFVLMHLFNTAAMLRGRRAGLLALAGATAMAVAFHSLLNAVGHAAPSQPGLLVLAHGLAMILILVAALWRGLGQRRLGGPAG